MNTLILKHPFIMRCIDHKELLTDCQLLNTFLRCLEKQSKTYAKGGDSEWIESESPKLRDEYKGWGFELFAEFLCKFLGNDKRVGVFNYEPVMDNDTGVDGVGLGVNGKVLTVQVKYRQANYELTANEDHLSNFKAASLSTKYGVNPVPVDGKCNMLIITSGKGLHYHTAQNMLPEVRVLDREKLRVLVDDHLMFWNSFAESWERSLNR